MRLFLLACLLFICTIAQATVYRWVDDNGKVHYSDEPTQNAEVVELKENTHNKVTIPKSIYSKTTDETKNTDDAVKYQLSITSPYQEETIRDNEGNITILTRTSPEPPKGSLYALDMDGVNIADAQSGSVFQLKNIDRGEHTFKLKLITQSGKVLASSSPRTVFLHRAHVGNVK